MHLQGPEMESTKISSLTMVKKAEEICIFQMSCPNLCLEEK